MRAQAPLALPVGPGILGLITFRRYYHYKARVSMEVGWLARWSLVASLNFAFLRLCNYNAKTP